MELRTIPYIANVPRARRDELDAHVGHVPLDVGELTYVLTREVVDYLDREGLSFAHLGEAEWACEATKLELYRRVGAPYEDMKCRANGDVYENLTGQIE